MKLHFFLILLFCGTLLAADLPRTSFFVVNEGQWEAPFAFRYDGAGGSYYITSDGLTIDLRQYERSAVTEESDRLPWERRDSRPELVRGHVVKVKYLNANLNPEIVGEDKLPHYSNYFLGQDSCKWRSFVGHYRRMMAENVWTGVDVEYRIEPEGIESVYHLAAGVDPSVIQIQYDGLDAPLRTDIQGNLILQTSLGLIKEKAPYACQVWQGKREEVAVTYQITGGNTIRLACSGYDRNIGMVIDPLLYSSYLGGNVWDYVDGIDVSPDGRIVISGNTSSLNFPITPGAYQETGYSFPCNAGFITVLTPDADSLVFSTYISGQCGLTSSINLAVCPNGSIWIAGNNDGSDWPLTANAIDTVREGADCIYTLVSADGSTLLYSSYLGGNFYEVILDIALDANGKLIMVGSTDSYNFPVTSDAFTANREAIYDGFISVFDPVQPHLIYSTYIPGNYEDRAERVGMISPSKAWVTGLTSSSNFRVTADALQPYNASGGGSDIDSIDGFFMVWDLAAHQLEYSSYLGGTAQDWINDIYPIDSNRLIIVGSTISVDFPILPTAIDTTFAMVEGYIMMLQLPDSIVRSTFWGGTRNDRVMRVNASDHGIVVIGETVSTDFPVTPDADDTLLNRYGYEQGNTDLFVSRLTPDLSQLEFSTYIGGNNSEYTWANRFVSEDTIWISDYVASSDYPTTENAVQSQFGGSVDGFITKFALPYSGSSVTTRPRPIPRRNHPCCLS